MASTYKAVKISQKHLLGIQDLSVNDINVILNEAKNFISLNKSKNKKLDVLRGKTQINLFFEPSTRTQSSFELAGKRLGADVMSMNITNSAIKKGETLIDTAMTLNAMHPDIIVIRHQDSGACNLLSQKVNCAVLNAGDGRREHPTQALLDALTIIDRKKKIEGLRIAICGDILHSRVALSNIYAVLQMGVQTLDTSVAGLGGCPYAKGATGNVATEDVLYMLNGIGIKTGIKLEKIIEVSWYISNYMKRLPNSKVARAYVNQ